MEASAEAGRYGDEIGSRTWESCGLVLVVRWQDRRERIERMTVRIWM